MSEWQVFCAFECGPIMYVEADSEQEAIGMAKERLSNMTAEEILDELNGPEFSAEETGE